MQSLIFVSIPAMLWHMTLNETNHDCYYFFKSLPSSLVLNNWNTISAEHFTIGVKDILITAHLIIIIVFSRLVFHFVCSFVGCFSFDSSITIH